VSEKSSRRRSWRSGEPIRRSRYAGYIKNVLVEPSLLSLCLVLEFTTGEDAGHGALSL
jgi:hypothetical protein